MSDIDTANTRYSTVDMHTGGEPFRIVVGGLPEIGGATVADRREAAIGDERVQAVRRLLCNEPRGHADMYGGFLVQPDDDGADLGVLFWHKDGFSTACGHGTIALGVWAVQEEMVTGELDGVTSVTIDVPSGRVIARVHCSRGVPQSVTFRNVPAYVIARDLKVSCSHHEVPVDLACGGAIYASVPAAALGLSVQTGDLDALITASREIKAALKGSELTRHPTDDRISGLYGVMFYDDLGDLVSGPQQRNVTIFADGEVDRSPCGSGTSARLALLADEGRMAGGATLSHLSIVDSEFLGRVVEQTEVDGRTAFITDVEGMAYRTGRHEFLLDPDDPIGTGFSLR